VTWKRRTPAANRRRRHRRELAQRVVELPCRGSFVEFTRALMQWAAPELFAITPPEYFPIYAAELDAMLREELHR
jgi:hypothetical protein